MRVCMIPIAFVCAAMAAIYIQNYAYSFIFRTMPIHLYSELCLFIYIQNYAYSYEFAFVRLLDQVAFVRLLEWCVIFYLS